MAEDPAAAAHDAISLVRVHRLARSQRRLVRLILVAVLVSIGLGLAIVLSPPAAGDILMIVLTGIQLAALLGCIVLSVEILSALGVSAFLRMLAAFSILVLPWLSIVICLGIAGLAARALKRIGLPVGLTGVSDEVVSQLLSGLRCLSCGYSLIGNVSGVCPECGCATRGQQTLPSSEKAVPDRSFSSTEGI